MFITVCAVAPTTDVALGDPGPAWEEAMLRTLAKVVPGLEENTLFVDRFSVEFMERWIGKEFGPAVSTVVNAGGSGFLTSAASAKPTAATIATVTGTASTRFQRA